MRLCSKARRSRDLRPAPGRAAAETPDRRREGRLANFRKYRKDGEGDPPKFGAYRSKPVRAALETLFHGKCAYCESRIGHITSTDVEHWRPKGRISTEDGKLVDGYWWLAAEWTNLFPSCQHCNRPTKHEAFAGGTTAGKGTRFPLNTPRTAAPVEGDERTEQPLILNPCDPTRPPDRHLVISHGPDPGVIRAADDGTGGDDPIGRASIDVYALDRHALVDRRAERVELIREAVTTIKAQTVILDAVPKHSPAATAAFDTIKRQRGRLNAWLADDAEYLLFARQLAGPVLDAGA